MRARVKMSYIVKNAVIMAAGTSSRFAPISYEKPKALITVKGEVLIERQICQLREAGIQEIIVVVGYKKEQFYYLEKKYDIKIIENEDYLVRNNNGSIYAVRNLLNNTYICSADNYFSINPFEMEVDESYYSAVFSKGDTTEWCLEEDEKGYINKIQIGGHDSWFMLGHTFWSWKFSEKFCRILEAEYDLPDVKNLLWEGIYCNHLDELKMKIRKYEYEFIYEFDTLDELRDFDIAYINNSNSNILKFVSEQLRGYESDITNIFSLNKENNEASGFNFLFKGSKYQFTYENKEIRRI